MLTLIAGYDPYFYEEIIFSLLIVFVLPIGIVLYKTLDLRKSTKTLNSATKDTDLLKLRKFSGLMVLGTFIFGLVWLYFLREIIPEKFVLYLLIFNGVILVSEVTITIYRNLNKTS